DGRAANTVSWYQGENSETTTSGWSPRQEVTAQVHSPTSVQYGVREQDHAFAEVSCSGDPAPVSPVIFWEEPGLPRG
ncbi:hypothetical protein KC218_27055, partial [Mycobacterium tuberculosis]|nr:hypothetical protein [Mycobacterium tuberculosis]